MRLPAVLAIAVSAVSLALAAPASAQDALGAGDALDANLRVGSGGINTRRVQPDYRARNLLVTGNVAGGRGFRDSVGYTAARDFRGTTAGDDTFSFRADSAFSDFNLVNTGRTYQELRFGQALGAVEYRRDAYEPPVPTTGQLQRDALVGGELRGIDSRLNRDQIERLMIESTQDATYRRRVDPQLVGVRQVRETEDADPSTLFVSVSSLRGVVEGVQATQPQLVGLSEYDMARLREDLEAGRGVGVPGRPFQDPRLRDVTVSPDRVTDDAGAGARVEPGAPDARVERNAVDLRQPSQRSTDYEALLGRIAARYAERANIDLQLQSSLVDQLDEELVELRTELRALTEQGATPGAAEPPATGTPAPPVQRTEPDRGDADDDEADDGGAAIRVPLLLNHGERLDRLASPGDEGRFNELLAGGEQMLREGKYYWAERRFVRALRFTPEHPIATAGLGHAQLGAGLRLTASVTLYRLLVRHPEMIDVIYDPALLPRQLELQSAIDDMRALVASERSDDQVHAGFLMAYVGHQTADRAVIEEGLDVIATASPDDPLLPLLRDVWLDDGAGE